MNRFSASARSGSRAAFVGALLVGALVMSGILAWQVVDASHSHERVAHTALKEQALFAAWEFSNNARRMIGDKITWPGLEVVAVHGGKDPTCELGYPAVAQDWRGWEPGPSLVGAFFRIELESGELQMSAPDDPALAAWLRSRLDVDQALALGHGWAPVVADPADGGGVVVYRTYPEGESPELIFGFRLEPRGLNLPLSYAFTDPPLLPEALTEGRDNGLLFSVTVLDRAGTARWKSPTSYRSSFVATDTMGARFAGFETVLTVNPYMVESLTIGGFPASRLPVAVGLLLLTSGLVFAALYQLRREAELSRLRADFVSGVSHELRTPLAQIRMFAETLQLGRVRNDRERDRSLEIIVNESRRLTHQVENVLLYSRAEREALKVSREMVDLGRLTREVAEAFEPLARKAKATLRVETQAGLISRVDSALVRQVLLNLLDNATKYGPSGQTIELGVGLAAGGRLQLWVEDEGPGVPPEDRERIWAPYFRLQAHRESAVAGSGIGLSVVMKVVEALDGAVAVEDGESGGARFVVLLPAVRSSGSASARSAQGEAARTETVAASPVPGVAVASSASEG